VQDKLVTCHTTGHKRKIKNLIGVVKGVLGVRYWRSVLKMYGSKPHQFLFIFKFKAYVLSVDLVEWKSKLYYKRNIKEVRKNVVGGVGVRY
jgi:hypothetical protein